MREPAYNVLFLCTVVTSLPIGSIDSMSPGRKLREIGHLDDSTFDRPKAG